MPISRVIPSCIARFDRYSLKCKPISIPILDYMRHVKKICLLLLACTLTKPLFHESIQAAVPFRNREKMMTDNLDWQRLKLIEDSLKRIDPRNSIQPKIGWFVPGRIFFSVKLYGPAQSGDQQYVTLKEEGVQHNRCIAGALALSNCITPCAYDQTQVYVGVRYYDATDSLPYFISILDSNNPMHPCKLAYAAVDE
jgi:hypothetical protein